jgi:hypothetical protein
MRGISKRALQWYCNCCSVASVTKTFTLKDVQTIQHLIINVFATLATQQRLEHHCKVYLERPALPVEVTLNSR